MILLLSRGRIVGLVAIFFLVGIALATLGLISSASVRAVEALLFCSALLFSLWREPRIFLASLCCLSCCVGLLRVWTEGVPLLNLLHPDKAMRTASLIRTRNEEATVPVEMTVVRKTFTATIQRMLPREEAALLSGILYGERLFSKNTQQTFRRAGLMHIVAVSGANISILVLVLSRLVTRFGLSRKYSWGILTVGIFLFVLFVTPSASVMRAAVMGSLVELAPLVGRLVRSTRLLLIAACVFVAWQPSALLLDAGFILSFLAMLGLICLGPYLDALIPRRVPALLRETAVSTFAATLVTAPYLAWIFRSWSMLGCLTNLLIVPLVPWTMLFGAIALALPIDQKMFLPVHGCLSLILWIAHLTDHVTFGVWNNLSFSWVWMISIYILLFSLWRLGEQRKRLIHKKRI